MKCNPQKSGEEKSALAQAVVTPTVVFKTRMSLVHPHVLCPLTLFSRLFSRESYSSASMDPCCFKEPELILLPPCSTLHRIPLHLSGNQSKLNPITRLNKIILNSPWLFFSSLWENPGLPALTSSSIFVIRSVKVLLAPGSCLLSPILCLMWLNVLATGWTLQTQQSCPIKVSVSSNTS